MIVSRIDEYGNIKDAMRDLIARKLYMDNVRSPGHDFNAEDIALAFCFKILSLVYEASVKAVNKISSSYPARRYFRRCGESNRYRKAEVRPSDASYVPSPNTSMRGLKPPADIKSAGSLIMISANVSIEIALKRSSPCSATAAIVRTTARETSSTPSLTSKKARTNFKACSRSTSAFFSLIRELEIY
jgi:hypothetical protein